MIIITMLILPADGQWVVPFGVLIKDDKVGNTLEAPVGTLKAAKRKKILNYESVNPKFLV